MSQFPSTEFDREQFSGVVRLFPLPNLVMFPHVLQPLHIFEPRYRALMAEALATDGLITMAVLAPGWQKSYDERPAVQSVACLGRVTTHQQLADGRFNLLLQGLSRVRILEELPADKPFREARAELLEDHYSPHTVALRPALERRLIEAVRQFLAKSPEGNDAVEHLIRNEVPLGVLSDLFGYAADLDLSQKLQLLSEPNVDVRAQLLLDRFLQLNSTGAVPNRQEFPPQFSVN